MITGEVDAEQPDTVEDYQRWDEGQRNFGAQRQALVKDLIERYSEGASIRMLVASGRRSYGFVLKALTEAGVSLRAKGGAGRRRVGEKANRTTEGESSGDAIDTAADVTRGPVGEEQRPGGRAHGAAAIHGGSASPAVRDGTGRKRP